MCSQSAAIIGWSRLSAKCAVSVPRMASPLHDPSPATPRKYAVSAPATAASARLSADFAVSAAAASLQPPAPERHRARPEESMATSSRSGPLQSSASPTHFPVTSGGVVPRASAQRQRGLGIRSSPPSRSARPFSRPASASGDPVEISSIRVAVTFTDTAPGLWFQPRPAPPSNQRVRLASVTRQFTAAALMLLMEEGRSAWTTLSASTWTRPRPHGPGSWGSPLLQITSKQTFEFIARQPLIG